jgi:hypothetical protein
MSGKFRTPYGLSLGFNNQFAHHMGQSTLGTAGLVSQASGWVDVTNGQIFYTNNTQATVIVGLSSNTYSVNSGNEEGRIVRLWFLDNYTTISSNAQLKLQSPTFGGSANSTIELMYSRGYWWETDRSNPEATSVVSTSIGAGSGAYLNAALASIEGALVFTSTGTYAVIKAISNGYQGQVLSVVNSNSSGISTWIMAGGNIVLPGTNSYLMDNSGATVLVNNGGTWYASKSY